MRFSALLRMTILGVIIVPEFLFGPVDFAPAREALQKKKILPTSLTSAEIGEKLPVEITSRAFLSARVASAQILDELKTESEALLNLLAPLDGSVMGNDLASARTRLKDFLSRSGYQRPEGVAAGSIADLASTQRLNLILNTQVQMAYARGNFVQMNDPEQKALYPYLRYVADPRPTRRATHWALNGLTLRKDDPFWKTHTGPWDYNCFCTVEEASAPEAKGKIDTAVTRKQRTMVSTSNGKTFEVLPPESGFKFDPSVSLDKPFDAGIKDPAIRAALKQLTGGSEA